MARRKKYHYIPKQLFIDGIEAMINAPKEKRKVASEMWGVSEMTVYKWVDKFYQVGYDFDQLPFLLENKVD